MSLSEEERRNQEFTNLYNAFSSFDLPKLCKQPNSKVMHLVFINELNYQTTSILCKSRNRDRILEFIEQMKVEHWRIFTAMNTEELNHFIRR